MIAKDEREAMKDELCRILHEVGALKFGTFKLTSGRISPYYVDLRLVPSFPRAFKRTCELYVKLIRLDVGVESFDKVAGVLTAGLPFASLIAYELEKPLLYVRREARLHGTGRAVEGVLRSGDKVLIVDDVVTTGSSIEEVAMAVRAEGGVVNDAVVLIDRGEGGELRLKERGVRLHCLLKVSEAAKRLYEAGFITENQLEAILRQARG